MFAKIFVIVLAIGAFAAGLLSLRQSRLQAASELAQCQLRISTADDRLWGMRTQIAAAVTPVNVERLAASVGPLRPITVPDTVGPPLPSAVPTYAQLPAVVVPTPAPRVVNTDYTPSRAANGSTPPRAAKPHAAPGPRVARTPAAKPKPTRSGAPR